MKLKKELRS